MFNIVTLERVALLLLLTQSQYQVRTKALDLRTDVQTRSKCLIPLYLDSLSVQVGGLYSNPRLLRVRAEGLHSH